MRTVALVLLAACHRELAVAPAANAVVVASPVDAATRSDVACPATPPAEAGRCEGTEHCPYDALACDCVSICSGPSFTWVCGPPHPPHVPDPRCPVAVPNRGAPCASDGLECGFSPATCVWDIARCLHGAWQIQHLVS